MILSQKMVMCDMKTLIFFFTSYEQCQFFKKKDHMSRSSVKYQRKDPIMRNIHVNARALALTVQKLSTKFLFSISTLRF